MSVSQVETPPPQEKKPVRRSQGALCLWHGLSFPMAVRLLMMGVPDWWRRLPRIASVLAMSLYNSTLGTAESLLFRRRLGNVAITHPPVFILGHWRSGTTLLHNLLCADPQFTFPNTYQVMFPQHFLLTEKVVGTLTAPLVPKARPMDNVPAGWALPQEDEIALCVLTLLSPYLMLIFQGDRSKYADLFDLENLSEKDRQRWKDAFLRFLKKLTLRANKPIVLKSPGHTYRIPILLEMFPDARFIYIYREPYAVYKSSLHLRRALFEDNTLGRVNFEGLEEDTLVTYRHLFDVYGRTRHLIPPQQLWELRFEDLEADPVTEMRRIYDHFGFAGWDGLEQRIRQELPSHAKYRKNAFQDDPALLRRVYERWRPAFERYGYPSRLNGDEDRSILSTE